jgi:hypothetical protein
VEGMGCGIFHGIDPAFWRDREQQIRLLVLSGKMFKLYS